MILYDFTGDDNCVWELETTDQTAVVMRLYASNTGTISSLLEGHAFIGITNVTNHNVAIGNLSVPPNTEITLGTWGNKNANRIWYNLETYYANDLKNSVYTWEWVKGRDIPKINQYINDNNSWSAIFNCGTFAAGLWNWISNVKIPTAAPATLYVNILLLSTHDTRETFQLVTPIGYRDANGAFINKTDVYHK